MIVPGYDYEAFGRGVATLDGTECFVHRVLVARRKRLVDAWGGGQVETGCHRDWIPGGLLDCDGRMDAHHLLAKQWLKREFPNGAWALYPVGDGAWVEPDEEGGDWHWPLGAILSDPRLGILACRRHHDLLERALLRIHREELPARTFDFAAELGPRAEARLERDYRPAVSAGSSTGSRT